MNGPTGVTESPRRAPVAEGVGVPADAHEAYRRGLCRDCLTAWHAAGMTRCAACHAVHVNGGGVPALSVVAGGKRGSGPWRPKAALTVVKSA